MLEMFRPLFFVLCALVLLGPNVLLAQRAQITFDNRFQLRSELQTLKPNHKLNPNQNVQQSQQQVLFKLQPSLFGFFFAETDFIGTWAHKDAKTDHSLNKGRVESRQVYLARATEWSEYGGEVSLGKRRFEAGVGYFFQPFQRIGHKNREDLFEVSSGVWHIGWLLYGEFGSQRFTLFHPEQDKDKRLTFKKEEAAFDYEFSYFGDGLDAFFRLQGGSEGGQAAAALSWVLSDQLELHASGLAFSAGHQYDLKTQLDPLLGLVGSIETTKRTETAFQYLLGINWSPDLGLSDSWRITLISELYFDENAPNQQFWSEVNALLENENNRIPPADLGDLLTQASNYRHSLWNRLALEQDISAGVLEYILIWRTGETLTEHEHFADLSISYAPQATDFLNKGYEPQRVAFSAQGFVGETPDGLSKIIPTRETYQINAEWRF